MRGDAFRYSDGFLANAHLRGITDRAVAHQTRHRSLAALGIGIYTRTDNAWTDTAATRLGRTWILGSSQWAVASQCPSLRWSKC